MSSLTDFSRSRFAIVNSDIKRTFITFKYFGFIFAQDPAANKGSADSVRNLTEAQMLLWLLEWEADALF